MGQWFPGPELGKNPVPQVGDLYTLKGLPSFKRKEFWCSHIGIVVGVTDSSIERIDGNFNNKVKYTTLSRSSSTIHGYFRPDWSRVGVQGSYSNYSSPIIGSAKVSPYQAKFESVDALLREAAYLTDKLEPSIKSTDKRLSVINYTQGLSELVGAASPVVNISYTQETPQTSSVDSSGLNDVQKKIIEFFCGKGCQVSAGVAVCANIEQECNYKISCYEWDVDGYSGGICQWHKDRLTRMINYVGPDWRNDLTGQLNYLWYELSNSYRTVLSVLQSAANTLEAAKNATDVFVRRFEVPANVNTRSQERQSIASRIWGQLYGG